MRIIVFGASGKVGSLVVRRILDEGHKVVAFVYNESTFKNDDRLKVIQGDVRETEAVHQAMIGSDAVVSALGSWGTKTKDILSKGMANIVPSMQDLGIKRIVSLTGADALLPDEKPQGLQYVTRPLFSIVAGKILRDGEQHLKILQASNLDWTVVRSPVMNEVGSATYELNSKCSQPWETIHRKAVAKALAQLVTSNDFVRSAPFIKRS